MSEMKSKRLNAVKSQHFQPDFIRVMNEIDEWKQVILMKTHVYKVKKTSVWSNRTQPIILS